MKSLSPVKLFYTVDFCTVNYEFFYNEKLSGFHKKKTKIKFSILFTTEVLGNCMLISIVKPASF